MGDSERTQKILKWLDNIERETFPRKFIQKDQNLKQDQQIHNHDYTFEDFQILPISKTMNFETFQQMTFSDLINNKTFRQMIVNTDTENNIEKMKIIYEKSVDELK